MPDSPRHPGVRPPQSGRWTRGPRASRRRRRRRRLALNGTFLIATVLSSAYLVLWSPGAGEVVPEPSPTVVAPTPSASPTAAPSPTTPAPVLLLPGEFPTDGPGELRFAGGEGPVLGEGGGRLRFRVGVELGVEEDPDEVARFIDDTLADERGWTAGGDVQLQRVPADAAHDFTISLVTSQTAARMCATAGMDVIGIGLPEGGVSCHYTGQVVLNLTRWRLSVPDYVADEVPLEQYRQMVVNHEVGHALGWGHELCPGPGEPAPVMQQQTIMLDGCAANPWPFVDGQRYVGEPAT